MIQSDFNPILPIFYFSKRFYKVNICWLVNSYDFTSQFLILTTLLTSILEVFHSYWNSSNTYILLYDFTRLMTRAILRAKLFFSKHKKNSI